ncbi:MAG: CYTH domain-containing protein [Pseudobdellovibrionaceae bacterium]
MGTAKKGMIEKELKYALTKRDYQRLMRACRKKVRLQSEHLNCYFDDPKLKLRKKKYGLRVRIVDDKKAFVTLKHPARAGKKAVRSLKVRKEYEVPVNYKTAKAIIKGKKPLMDLRNMPVRVLRSAFSKNALQRIQPLGTIRTLRTVVVANGGSLELEIDKFKLFGHSYYELEVETFRPKRADQIVRWLFKENNIPYHPITKSKLGRFIEEWKKIR